MDVSRVAQEMERRHPELGGLALKNLPRLVAESRGKLWDRIAIKFYRNLLRHARIHLSFGAPPSIQEVRERLQAAWWVEEEDICQFCLGFIASQKKREGSACLKHLVTNLFVWLIKMRVFSRYPGWEEEYALVAPKPSADQSTITPTILLDTPEVDGYCFSTYERYIIYCLSLGYTLPGVAKLQNQERKQLYNEMNRFLARLQEKKNAPICN